MTELGIERSARPRSPHVRLRNLGGGELRHPHPRAFLYQGTQVSVVIFAAHGPPPQDVWQVRRGDGVLLVSSEKRPRMLLNTLQGTGRPHNKESNEVLAEGIRNPRSWHGVQGGWAEGWGGGALVSVCVDAVGTARPLPSSGMACGPHPTMARSSISHAWMLPGPPARPA